MDIRLEKEHLECMNEDLSINLDLYCMETKQFSGAEFEAVLNFVNWMIERNREAIDEPRGKSKKSYRDWAIPHERLAQALSSVEGID